MSCDNTTNWNSSDCGCQQTTSNSSDCYYDDCGCLNPTTFECVSQPGECIEAGVSNTMDGKQALAQYCKAIGDLKLKSGKVMVDSSDTCPDYPSVKFVAGMNMSIQVTGSGCNRQLVFHSTTGGVPVDVNVKVSPGDTTTDYLTNKLSVGSYIQKTILNPGGNEKISIDVNPSSLISSDPGNSLVIGSDGGLKTNCPQIDGSETKIYAGVGVIVSGAGTSSNPYVISTNPSIQVARPCFDGIWRAITLIPLSNPNVTYVAGTPEYRYRFDGSIEFRGSLTFNVNFGQYSSSNRKFTLTVGNIPTT